MPSEQKFKDIDNYISTFPKNLQEIMEKMRKTIKAVIPEAEEAISYQMPTFKINGKYVIYFAGYEKHVSLYPIHAQEIPFEKELEKYISGKATLKFPVDEEIRYDLIEKVTRFKLEQLKK